MNEKCPLQSAVARNVVIFNPDIMLDAITGNLQKKFRSLLQHLVSLLIVCSPKTNIALIQYVNVKTNLMKAAIDLSKISQLDDFYFKDCKVSRILLNHHICSDTEPWRSRC